MKRYNNLYEQIYSMDNLILADKKARLNKSKQDAIRFFDIEKEKNLLKLHYSLKNKTYKTSDYEIFYIYEPKERKVFKLPYVDRIVHHAIMNILEPIFVKMFTADTYSCIKNKGIHNALINLKTTLVDKVNTINCLKLDVKKFYPSVNHNILKQILRKKFKDNNLLWLLDEIIDSVNVILGGG